MRRRIILFLLTLVTIVTITKAQEPLPWNAEQQYPKQELRAVWVTTLGGLDWPKTYANNAGGRERQKQELCTLLDQLKACNINTVLLQTRIRGCMLYPSAIEPWSVCLTGQYDKDPGYDPLAFAIEETHKRGMELHAWVVTIPAFKTEAAKSTGKKSLIYTHPELLKKHNGMYYLDPGMPETADYIATICKEIVQNYDVDGLHFDYIRYPEEANSFPDARTYAKYGKGKSKADWRRDNITQIVRKAYHTVKAIKPWVKMSCSPVGKYRDTRRYSSKGWNCYDAVYQDAQGWLQEGIQDALYPMMYFTGNHFYPFAIDWQEGSNDRPIVPGLGIYFLNPKERDWALSVVGRELHYIRDNGLAGQAYFRCKFLTDNEKGLYDYLHDTFYAYPAITPRYPWIDDVPPTPPSECRIIEQDAHTSELQWKAATDNMPEAGVRYNIYADYSYPVDTEKAEHLMATNLTDCHFLFNHTLGLNLAITAIDRCGNESTPVQLGGGKQTDTSYPQKNGEHYTKNGEHYLKHDGQKLELPYLPDIEYYLITDLTGRHIRTGKWVHRIDISHLSRGVYRLRTLQKKGISRPVGEFKL